MTTSEHEELPPVEIHASLRIMGPNLDPTNLSSLLGATADKSHRLGESRPGKTPRAPYSEGLWSRRSRSPARSELVAHLGELVSFAKEHSRELANLRKEGNRLDLFVGIFSANTNYGVTLPLEIQQELANLELPLSLDFYYVGVD